MGEPYRPVKRETREFQTECQRLARNIEGWRAHKGLSMRKLRFLTDIPISRLTDIKTSDRADPKFTTILRLAKGLGITVEQLLEGPPHAG